MTSQRDPDQMHPVPSEPARQTANTAERNEMRRRENIWGAVPGIVGFVLILALGLLLLSGDPTPRPDQSTSTPTTSTTKTPAN